MLKIKNWEGFQHYKDRSPPWIKLHKALLDDFDFQCLPLASKALAPMLWLLASENMAGQIDSDPKRLAFRLRWTMEEVCDGLKPLIDAGFVIDDSNSLAQCLQDACLETEERQRKRTEGEADISVSDETDCRRQRDNLPCPHQKIIDLYHKLCPMMPGIVEWNNTRQGILRSLWNNKRTELKWKDEAEGLEYFGMLFAYCAKSKFLTGQVPPNGDRKPFVANLEWIIRPNNFAKISEGRYE